MLPVELAKSRRKHGLDFLAQGLHTSEYGPEALERLAVGLFDAELQALLVQGGIELCHLGLECRGTEAIEYVAQQLEVHRAYGMDLGTAEIEIRLLLDDAEIGITWLCRMPRMSAVDARCLSI